MTILNRLLGAVKYIVKKADMVLLGLCLVCTAFGVVLIASATGYLGLAEQVKRVLIQSAGAVMGVAAYFIFSNVDMEHFAEKWWLFLIFDIGFIALLRTPLGREAYGNRSWIYVGLPMMIQPAEIVRLTFTVLLARQIAWFRDNRRMRGFGSLFWPAAHALFMFVWIFLLSRDAGSGMMYPIIYMGMALAAGLAWYWFALAIGSLGVGIGLLAVFEKLPKYWMDRFHVILDHSYSPGGVGYQQSRGLLALGSGGLFGMVGCMVVIVLEFLVVYRCFQTARVAKSSMDALICVGFGTMLIFQTVENIGMCLFVMPVIGLTLPFFSYGGSSILSLFAAMGIVSGVRSRTLPDWLRMT